MDGLQFLRFVFYFGQPECCLKAQAVRKWPKSSDRWSKKSVSIGSLPWFRAFRAPALHTWWAVTLPNVTFTLRLQFRCWRSLVNIYDSAPNSIAVSCTEALALISTWVLSWQLLELPGVWMAPSNPTRFAASRNRENTLTRHDQVHVH